MRIELTAEQIEQLAPLFADVDRAADLGLLGMLVAQVDGRGFMTVGFIRNAQARHLVWAGSEQFPKQTPAQTS